MTQNNPAKNPVVSADTDISGKKQRKSRSSINWLKLGTDKDPNLNDLVALCCLGKQTAEYKIGFLESKTESTSGKKFTFSVEGDEYNHFTHYVKLNPPLE